ncbi:uncharacterized protein [Miscanthus floridulus]|uniref:uncharacterized protein n=1 Tax=Miscanthus floridulus TaxID=154761 RepID=UPI00345752C7
MDNFGVLSIVEGEIDEAGILQNLRELFDKDWNWQLKKTDDTSYIVRFPPSRKVENVVIGKASLFQLNRPKVVASLSVWNGYVEPVGNLVEVWVQIKGIPPKWVDWNTVREVASSLDPTRILRGRLYVFKARVYKISFNPEGYVQVDNSTDGDSGDVEELEEDDLLDDDDPKDIPKGNDDDPKKDKEHEPREREIPEPSDKPHGGGSSAAGSKSTKRALLFEDDSVTTQKDVLAIDCANLLGAMELEVEDGDDEVIEDESSLMLHDDNERIQLPDEWIYDLQAKNTSLLDKDIDNNSSKLLQ